MISARACGSTKLSSNRSIWCSGATAVGTPLGEGKEQRHVGERDCVLEHGITADFAIIKARRADRLGNLLFNKTARNFSPLMCMAAKTSIVQTGKLVARGDIDPEHVVTPGIFVNRIVEVPDPVHEDTLIAEGRSYP